MPTKNDLLLAMTGHASTNKWDIVCCYREDTVNNIFKEKYKQGKLAADVKLKSSYEDPIRGEIMFESNLTLHEPELQFVTGTTSTICQLNMPILSGSCTLTPKSGPNNSKTYKIDPDVLQIVGNIPLAASSGDTEEGHDGTCPIIFKDSTITAQQVFLHFKNVSETTFDIVSVPSKEGDAHKQLIYQENIPPEIITLITTFFKEEVSEISYSMGAISSSKVIEIGLKTIHPKSFIFSVSKPDNDSPACLNLYIQSVESGNPPGDPEPSFKPDGCTISPVPAGCTGSLILSGDFMGKLLVSLLSDKGAKFCTNTDGLSIQINIAKIFSYPGSKHSSSFPKGSFNFSGINISNTPMTLNFNPANKSDSINKSDPTKNLDFINKLKVTINSSYSGDYHWHVVLYHMDHGFSGKITASLEVDEIFDLKLAPDGMLQFNFTLDQSGIKNVNVDDSTKDNIQTESIRDDIKNSLPPAIRAISVNMDRVNMFAISNLLFPGQNKLYFTGGDSFYVPHDLIVFGNINK